MRIKFINWWTWNNSITFINLDFGIKYHEFNTKSLSLGITILNFELFVNINL